MRDLGIAVVFGLAALVLAACGSPMQTAQRTVDTTAKVLITTDAQVKRVTRTGLTTLAHIEGAALGQELRRLGCPSGATSQPATAPAACHAAVAANQARYEARKAQIKVAVERSERVLDTLKTQLLLIVGILEDYEAGSLSKAAAITQLAALVAGVPALCDDAKQAYQAVKTLVGGLK